MVQISIYFSKPLPCWLGFSPHVHRWGISLRLVYTHIFRKSDFPALIDLGFPYALQPVGSIFPYFSDLKYGVSLHVLGSCHCQATLTGSHLWEQSCEKAKWNYPPLYFLSQLLSAICLTFFSFLLRILRSCFLNTWIVDNKIISCN